jgi:phosphoserine phosphatase RsbX
VTHEAGAAGGLRWAVGGLALAGETVSGDLHFVAPSEAGALFAVIDGLGHGPMAAEAARAAAAALALDPAQPVEACLERCHHAMSRTRGAVLALAQVQRQQLCWIGVGNVQAIVYAPPGQPPTRRHLSQAGGVVGHRLPPQRPQELPLAPGSLLVMATDGLRADFWEHVARHLSPAHVVHHLLNGHRSGLDDALVLAARIGELPA